MVSRKYLALFLVIVLSAILFFSFQNKSSSENPVETRDFVRVGFMPITADYQYFIAKEKGFFEQESLTVEEVQFASSNLMLEALVQGKIDVIASAAAPTAYIIDEKSPGFIKIFAYTDDNNLPSL